MRAPEWQNLRPLVYANTAAAMAGALGAVFWDQADTATAADWVLSLVVEAWLIYFVIAAATRRIG